VFVIDHGEITEADLGNVPDIATELEGEVSAEAEKVVTDKLEEKSGSDSKDGLTATGGEEIPQSTIGYEGGKYATAEELTSHIEDQWKEMDAVSSQSQSQVKADPGSFSQN
jgi:hypothetical protein